MNPLEFPRLVLFRCRVVQTCIHNTQPLPVRQPPACEIPNERVPVQVATGLARIGEGLTLGHDKQGAEYLWPTVKGH